MQHGLSERRAEAPERASEEGGGETRNLSGVGAVGRPQRQIEPQPMSRGSESPEAPSELVEQPTGPGSKLHESEMRYIATTLSPSALEGQEDRHVDRPSGARSRVPGSGVRGRGSGERETTASSLAGKQQAREKEDNGGQGKDGPAGAIAQGGNGR